jgi:hypothetical protein
MLAVRGNSFFGAKMQGQGLVNGSQGLLVKRGRFQISIIREDSGQLPSMITWSLEIVMRLVMSMPA